MGKFIVIEGIDASGKSTIAQMILKCLEAKGQRCRLLSKKEPELKEGECKEYIERLKEIIWFEKKRGTPWGFLTQQQWYLQILLWYSVLADQYIQPLKKNDELLIMDGWIYKMYARFLLEKDSYEYITEDPPAMLNIADEVFLLKEEPSECWKRREFFKDSEIAPYGEVIVNPQKSFIDYQGNVQNELCIWAKKFNWNIVSCSGKNAEEISLEISKKILDFLCKPANK